VPRCGPTCAGAFCELCGGYVQQKEKEEPHKTPLRGHVVMAIQEVAPIAVQLIVQWRCPVATCERVNEARYQPTLQPDYKVQVRCANCMTMVLLK
jgi:hypothetical protein